MKPRVYSLMQESIFSVIDVISNRQSSHLQMQQQQRMFERSNGHHCEVPPVSSESQRRQRRWPDAFAGAVDAIAGLPATDAAAAAGTGSSDFRETRSRISNYLMSPIPSVGKYVFIVCHRSVFSMKLVNEKMMSPMRRIGVLFTEYNFDLTASEGS